MDRLIAIRNFGMALFAAVLVAVAWVPESKGERTSVSAELATNLEIILQLDHDNVGAGDAGSWIPIYLTNILQDVGGFELSLLLDRPDLFKFSSDSVVETTIVCIDEFDCDPADTTIDTVQATTVDTAGTVVSGWEIVNGRAISDFNWKLIALAGDTLLKLTPTGTPRLVARVYIEKIASEELLDTLTDRTAIIYIVKSYNGFSDPAGMTIGRHDSTVDLDSTRYDTIISCDTLPPFDCDTTEFASTLDTIYYTDSTEFAFFDGSRTFLSSCVNGDVNETGIINATDVIYLVNFLFNSGPAPTCSLLTGDVNCTGTTTAADIIYLVNFVFNSGPPPGVC